MISQLHAAIHRGWHTVHLHCMMHALASQIPHLELAQNPLPMLLIVHTIHCNSAHCNQLSRGIPLAPRTPFCSPSNRAYCSLDSTPLVLLHCLPAPSIDYVPWQQLLHYAIHPQFIPRSLRRRLGPMSELMQ